MFLRLLAVELSDVHQGHLPASHLRLQASHKGSCRIQAGQTVHAGFNGGTADQEAISGFVASLGGGVDDQINPVAQNQTFLAFTPASFSAAAVLLVA